MSTINVPDHIIQEILSRSPAKSLLRFRCVCKAWRSLINDQEFINLQLLRSKERGATSIIFLHFQSFMFSVDPENPSTKMVSMGTTSDFLAGGDLGFNILGSCNGLLCIARTYGDKRVLSLFNPSTRKGTSFTQEKDLEEMHGYGFFCDPTEGSYKFLLVSNYEAMVYTFGENSWKTIGTIPYDLSFLPKGILVHGSLHWFAPECVVVAFNPTCEKFHEIPHPENVRDAISLVFVCELELTLGFAKVSYITLLYHILSLP
ncbi:hypothetical protein ACHQM5_013286 [Ranunculus cassubicifolius]